MGKVVELVGFTGVEPCTATLPTAGSISASVASVEVHERGVESPLLIVEGDAESVTVGCAAAGAGAACVGGTLATCFLQPPMNTKTVATPNKSVNFRIVPACINFLLPRFPGFLTETAGIFSAAALYIATGPLCRYIKVKGAQLKPAATKSKPKPTFIFPQTVQPCTLRNSFVPTSATNWAIRSGLRTSTRAAGCRLPTWTKCGSCRCAWIQKRYGVRLAPNWAVRC